MHHSPSSLSTAASCERKWWYDHVERRREPDVTWEQIEAAGADWQKIATPHQRSAARGTAVHAVFEEYYEGGSPNWASYIGQIAITGRAHLPLREACSEIRVERSIGDDPYPADHDPGRTALMLDGVRFLGYVDLEVRLDPDGAEARRLGISEAVRAGDGWYTFDYKTSKAVHRYAITPEKARTDPQGVLYPAAGMIRAGTEARGMRWVYMQTEGKPYAKPVDALVTYEGSKAHLRTMIDRGRELEQKKTIEDTAVNTDACTEYGGCPHHVTRGGPCKAQRNIGRIAAMGFRDAYLKAKNAEGAAAPSTTPAAETPAQTAAPAAPPKRAFGKKAETAPTADERQTEASGAPPVEPPAGANGPAPTIVNTTTINQTPTETPAAKRTRAPKAALEPLEAVATVAIPPITVELRIAGLSPEQATALLAALK